MALQVDNIRLEGGNTVSMSAEQGGDLSSATRTYEADSGRNFFAHLGTGSSAEECSFELHICDYQNGGKVYLDVTSALDGVAYMVYKCQITVWDGTTKTQEEVRFTKVLTASTSTFPNLCTEELEFGSGVLAALITAKNITLKVTRDAGDGDDDYSGLAYTEMVYFKYNY